MKTAESSTVKTNHSELKQTKQANNTKLNSIKQQNDALLKQTKHAGCVIGSLATMWSEEEN